MMSKRFTIFLLSFLFFSKVYSQTWEKASYVVFKKEFSQFLQKQPDSWYTTTIKTSVYTNAGDANAENVQVSKLNVYGPKDFVFQSGEAIQMQKGDLKLDIDTSDKQVLLSNAVEGSLMGFQPKQFDHIDSSKYEFYKAVKGSRKLLKVVEKVPLSSMQVLVFEFDVKGDLRVLEMWYWPSNYTMSELADETIEQPLVRLEYGIPVKTSPGSELENQFDQWLLYNSKTKVYSCPDKNYMFYDLLNKK